MYIQKEFWQGCHKEKADSRSFPFSERKDVILRSCSAGCNKLFIYQFVNNQGVHSYTNEEQTTDKKK